MQKRKVLFCLRDFNHGGIPRCLEQLLLKINHNKYDVTIYCGDQSGIYKDTFKKYNVINQSIMIYYFFINYKKQKGIKKIIAVIVKTIRFVLLKIGIDILNLKIRLEAKKLEKQNFDVYVAFSEGFPTELISYINNDNKYSWVHCDYAWSSPFDNKTKEAKYYSVFKKIVCVSLATKKSFDNAFPFMSSRTIVIHNVIDQNFIINKSNELEEKDRRFSNDIFTILSLGRICYQKQFNSIPKIAYNLLHKKINFKWYIVGPGPDKEVEILLDEIDKYKIYDNVILLGPKSNPYYYLKRSNLFVLTSRYESYPTVINEAKICDVPIVSTDFDGYSEIIDKDCGLVSSINEISCNIFRMITNVQLYTTIKTKLKNYKYDNLSILEEIDKLLMN